MSSESIPVADLAGLDAIGGRIIVGDLEPDTELADLDLEECRIERAGLELSTWRRCSFDTCTFVGVNLSMSRLVDVRFAECTMVESKAQAVSWTGLRTSGLAERPISFERCRLDYSSFMEVDLRRARFIGCSLVDADFAGSDLRETEFVDCDVSGTRFAGADVRGARFAQVRGLGLDVRETRSLGLRVDTAAALDLIATMGIEVDD